MEQSRSTPAAGRDAFPDPRRGSAASAIDGTGTSDRAARPAWPPAAAPHPPGAKTAAKTAATTAAKNGPRARALPLAFPDARSRVPKPGRGAVGNPAGRFEKSWSEAFDDGWTPADDADFAPPPLRTTVTEERAKTVITRNTSPDVPFDRSLNAYRGCEHGCVYCFARPTHAFLGLSPGLDFESRLFAKPEAARLLEAELSRPSYRCQVLAMGTNTDPYQPIERTRRITRAVLEVLDAFSHPTGIVTKSALVARDVDILGDMAARNLASVGISVTTLDRRLARRMEPRAATPAKRLATIRSLADAGIPVRAMVAPVIPGLTDTELEDILEAARDAGATSASFHMLRLPFEVKDLFAEWLEAHVPKRARHVLALVRDMRDGRLNDPDFGSRHSGTGAYARMIERRFVVATRKLGLDRQAAPLDTTQFRVPDRSRQLTLFG